MSALLRTGEISAAELLDAHLATIERQDHALNAWQSIDAAGRARRRRGGGRRRCAAARGEGSAALDALPPLHGIPVALKDLVVTRGQPSTAGSRILHGYRGVYDADIAERLAAAGAVIPGKTNMDEFAMGSSTEHCAWGPVANPWDLSRVPGGSSGGSAAAVAAYHVPLAIGTDTGGSIRQPAALTGTVGLRPTYGRVSRYGIIAFASSLDQVGPFARDVRDAALLLGAIAGHDPRDSTSAPVAVPDYAAALPRGDDEAAAALRGMRLGLPRQYFVAGMEPGVEARVREAVAALQAAGAEIVDVDLPHTDYGLATYYIIAPAEASANLARYDGIRFGHSVRGGDVLVGLPGDAGDRLRAGGQAAHHARHVRAVGRLLRRLLPQGAQGPDAHQGGLRPGVRVGRRARRARPARRWPSAFGARMDDPVAMYLSDACTLPVNVAGLAGLSVPCGLSDGLPVGLQFIGKPFDELTLFRLGRAWEALSAGAAWRSVEPSDLARLDDPATQPPARPVRD